MVLSILGIIGGGGVTLMAVFVAPAFAAVFNILGISVLLFWIWMLWTGSAALDSHAEANSHRGRCAGGRPLAIHPVR
jgi:hypothetical protein